MKATNPDPYPDPPGGEDPLPASPESIPPHPTHNRKEIVAFIVVVLAVCGLSYGLSRFRNWETSALYVFTFGPLLGLLAIFGFRTVRGPQCRLAMRLVCTTKITGTSWQVFHCPQCGGQWRVQEPICPAI